MKIKDIMKYPVISMEINENIEKTLNIMNTKDINGMPVLDKKGTLVGMVVKADIYRFLMDPGHYKTCPVDWVMTKEVVTVGPEVEIIEGIRLLRKNDIIAMPVVEGKQVIGMISVEDILDYFLTVL